MKKIKLFENAIKNEVPNLRKEGINPTLFWAYRYSVDAENEHIDFSEVIWDDDVAEICEFFKANGICEFTISSTFSSLIPTLAKFAKYGFQVGGLTEVNEKFTDFFTGKRAKVPAIRMTNIYGGNMKYIAIQNEVISKYNIDICDGTKCKNDWKRTHAHPKQRRVCKWKQANSITSTFTLFHEIGHIMTDKGGMRRAEQEYYATVWAIEECKKYGLQVPQYIIDSYQRYIDMSVARGERRGGTGYGKLQLQ